MFPTVAVSAPLECWCDVIQGYIFKSGDRVDDRDVVHDCYNYMNQMLNLADAAANFGEEAIKNTKARLSPRRAPGRLPSRARPSSSE